MRQHTTVSRVRYDGGQMVSDGSSASVAFAPEASGAVSADPLVGAGWVPSAAVLGVSSGLL